MGWVEEEVGWVEGVENEVGMEEESMIEKKIQHTIF